MNTVSSAILISCVRPDGQVERLGSWDGQRRALELTAPGFPFLPLGRHVLEGELPWVFRDMCPSGYLGRRLAARAELPGLGPNPRHWMAADVLRVLQAAGSDLGGNLLVGQEAVRAFEARTFDPRAVGELLDDVLRDA